MIKMSTKNRHRKMKIIHKVCVFLCFVDIFISAIPVCYFCISFEDIAIYVCAPMYIACMFFLMLLTFLFARFLLRTLKTENKTIGFNMKLEYSKNASEMENVKHARIFYYDERFLKTIVIHQIEDFDIKSAKAKMKKTRREIRSRIPSANKGDSWMAPHWMLDLDIFVFGDGLSIGDAKDFISKFNNDKNYFNGKFRAAYSTADKTMIIRTYDGDDLDLYNFFTYDKCLKTLCSLFDLSYSDLINQL